MPISYNLFGDKMKALSYIAEGQRILFFVKQIKQIKEIEGIDSYQLSRTYNDGTSIVAQSIFGNDYITIRSPFVAVSEGGKEPAIILFLFKDNTNYCTWILTPELQIISYQYGIADYIKYPTPISFGGYTSIFMPAGIQSNDALTEHYYTEDNREGEVVNSSLLIGLGVVITQDDYCVLYQNRNSYAPIGWSSDDEKEYDDKSDYLYYPTIQSDPPAFTEYVCSARHDWIIDEYGDVLKELELWTIDAYTAHVKYRKLVGEEEQTLYGDTFDFYRDMPGKYPIHAVLSPTKVIGKVVQLGEEVEEYAWSPYTIRDCYENEKNGSVVTSYLYDTMYRYYFGDVELETFGVHQNAGSSLSYIECDCYLSEAKSLNLVIASYAVDWYAPGASIRVMSYDNRNVDETFVAIYYKVGGCARTNAIGWRWLSFDEVVEYRTDSVIYVGVQREFYVVYRCKGGSLRKKIITYGGLCVTQYSTPTGGECEDGDDLHEDAEAIVGQSVFNASCIIAGNFMVYTYTVWDATPESAHMDDQREGSWTFNRRVIGVIDIEKDELVEHVITENIDNFDPSTYAAVGIHEGEIQKES